MRLVDSHGPLKGSHEVMLTPVKADDDKHHADYHKENRPGIHQR
jgi:hypothetical protein